MQEIERGKALQTVPASAPPPVFGGSLRPGEVFTRRNVQIGWSRNGISLHYDRHALGASTPSFTRRMFGAWPVVLLGSLLAMGAVAATVGRASSQSAPQVWTQDLPPRVSSGVAGTAQEELGRKAKRVARNSGGIARSRAARHQTSVAGPEAAVEGADLDILPTTVPGAFAGQGSAVKAALASGELQSWEDGTTGQRGFVVVGPAQIEGGRTCRDVSILIREDGAQNRVNRDHRCG
jgi:hypothetical protein